MAFERMSGVVNIGEKLSRIAGAYAPAVIATVNDYHVKLVKARGEFVWHRHDDTDELFLVIAGALTIRLRDGEVHLSEGELYVVPRGVEHKPVAPGECHLLLLEPAGTVNTGNNPGEMTVAAPPRL